MAWTTTLNKIRKHDPCADGWKKLLDGLGKTEADDGPLPVADILRISGVDDALWALQAVDGHDRDIRHCACDYAEMALTYEREIGREPEAASWKAVEVSRRYADGQATVEELINSKYEAMRASRISRTPASDSATATTWLDAVEAVRSVAVSTARNATMDVRNKTLSDVHSTRDVEREWQTARLLHYINGGQPEERGE